MAIYIVNIYNKNNDIFNLLKKEYFNKYKYTINYILEDISIYYKNCNVKDVIKIYKKILNLTNKIEFTDRYYEIIIN